MDLRKRIHIVTFLCIMVVQLLHAHNVQKRDARAEQERIRQYQMGLQEFISSQEEGREMRDRTEPLQCYSCLNARTNKECNDQGMQTCLPTQTTCQTEIRVFNPKNYLKIRIKKGCKQQKACTNNFLQNDRQAWPSTQCNYIPRTLLSVCRYCCMEPGCNQQLPDHICGPVHVPENGGMNCQQNTGFRTSTCTFTCSRCHRMSGSKVRMCLENNMWSGTDTECVYDETLPGCAVVSTCPIEMTLSPLQGLAECSNGNQFGSECRYICDRGYVLNGRRVLRCDGETKQWDDVKPICIRGDDSSNPCHHFALFEYAPDGKLECECSTGFTGDGFITCDDTDECAEGLHLCSDDAACVNNVGSYSCECLPGYQGDGFECRDINECLSNTDNDCDQENGVCLNADGGYSCSCSPGYIGDGQTCTEPAVECPGGLIGDFCPQDEPIPPPLSDEPTDPSEPLEPDEITTPKHDDPTTPQHDFFSEMTEIIEPPFEEEGPAPDSLIAEDVRTCIRMAEHQPPMVRERSVYEDINTRLLQKLLEATNNTRVSVIGPWVGLDDRLEPGVLRWRDGRKLGDGDMQMWAPGQPKMVDSRGFGNCVNLVSDPVGSLTESFLWSITLCSDPARYVCDSEKNDEPSDLTCLPLTRIPKGSVSCPEGWVPGASCYFSCDEGHVLRGESTKVTCTEDLMWDNEPPTCVRAVCRPLLTPNSGVMSCTDGNRENSVCTFACKTGYKLHGSETVTCQRDLKWSDQRPCCRDDCPPYARMNLILVLDSSKSIRPANFNKTKAFARRLAGRFEISEDFTHVGVMTYNRRVRVLNRGKMFTSSEELDLSLENLPYKGSGTFIGKAIDYVTEHFTRRREGTHDVVVILTDGKSHDDVYVPAMSLRNTEAHVISVGIKHALRYQLELIASEPSDLNVVEVESFEQLDNLVNTIGDKVCRLQC